MDEDILISRSSRSEEFKSVDVCTFARKRDLISTAFREQVFNELIQAQSTGDGFLLGLSDISHT